MRRWDFYTATEAFVKTLYAVAHNMQIEPCQSGETETTAEVSAENRSVAEGQEAKCRYRISIAEQSTDARLAVTGWQGRVP